MSIIIEENFRLTRERGRPRQIERPLVSVFHETEMKIWAGQIFLAAHTVLPN